MLPRLKELRQEFGMSQQALGSLVGLAQQSINQYENHNIEPEISVLSQMADYFNTSIDYIVGRTDIRRRIEPTTACDLNAEELELITQYRSLSKEGKACVKTVIQTLQNK